MFSEYRSSCTIVNHYVHNTCTTYFNVGNSTWNKFVKRNRAYWASFIRKVVLKKSSGRPVLVVRYENIKRNRSTEVEGYRGRRGEGEERERAEISFYFHYMGNHFPACHIVCLGVTHLGLSKYELFTTRSERETAGGCHNISTQAICEH